MLVGTISSEALAGPMDLNDLVFEDNTLSFNFESGQFGMLEVTADLEGDALNGSINVEGYGVMPLKGMRMAEE
jgi:hypothetical protein